MAAKKPIFLCKSHPDFHIPPDVEVGEGFDGDSYVRRMKECGADAVAFFAKCHYGHAYYYTKVGTPHPGLKKDMLREVSAACSRHGVGMLAYYSVFLDTAAVLRHPDWELKPAKEPAQAQAEPPHFRPVCVNSGYVDELMLPQCKEIVSQYEVDELILDTMSNFQPCYCESCRRLFGRQIPESPADPAWMDYVRWYAGRFEEFFARVAAQLHEANPRVSVWFNWKWGIREPSPPQPHIGRLAADDRCSGIYASLHCRYFASTGLPYDYMTGRFLHGLGDWTSNTSESLRYAAAATVANGGSFYIIDRQKPDGSLEERAWEAMRDVFGFVQERRQWICGASHVPETAVLWANSHLMGSDLRYFPNYAERRKRMEANEGSARLLMERARHFTVLNAESLPELVGRYRLLIVPEQDFLDESTRAAIRRFVEGGGALLLTQSASPDGLYEDLLALAGVKVEGFTELDYGYFGTEPPLHVRGQFARAVPLEGTEVLCPHVAPVPAGKGGKRFGHGLAPPGQKSGLAAITFRRAGKGCVAYVAAPVFKAQVRWPDPHVARLILSVVDKLLPDPLARASTPAQVEMSLMRNGNDLLLHLVNHSGRKKLGNYYWPVFEHIPEVRNIKVAIKSSRRRSHVLMVPEKRKLPCKYRGGYLELAVPRLHVMASLLVPGYFASAKRPTGRRSHNAHKAHH